MGMYDELYISTDMLPVSDKEKRLIGDKPGWQTKSLDCEMTRVYITSEGYLEIDRFEYESTPREEKPYPDAEKGTWKYVFGMLRETNNKRERLDNYHGFVTFYTRIGEVYRKTGEGLLDRELVSKGEWYEFSAKFTDGKLTEIKGGKKK